MAVTEEQALEIIKHLGKKAGCDRVNRYSGFGFGSRHEMLVFKNAHMKWHECLNTKDKNNQWTVIPFKKNSTWKECLKKIIRCKGGCWLVNCHPYSRNHISRKNIIEVFKSGTTLEELLIEMDLENNGANV